MRWLNARLLTASIAMALALVAMVQGVDVVRAALAQPAARSEADWRQRHDALAQMLAARPLAAQDWAALAALRDALAMPDASVDAAFMMSGVAGPDEGDVMARRALLGLLLWERHAAMRARTLTDLCGLTVYDSSRLRLVLSTKAEPVRTAIRSGLADHGCSTRMMTSIGL